MIVKPTIVTAYYDHKHRRLKVPYNRMSVNPNSAILRCTNNLMLNRFGATYAEVYDKNTAEHFASFKFTKKGELITAYRADPRNAADPIRRTSIHALFHELEIMYEVEIEAEKKGRK